MVNSLPKSIELKQMYYFVVTAEELSLHRAAERLFISQPPLSRRIKQIEEQLGTVLFIRHTRGLRLTPDGQKTLQAFRALLDLHSTSLARLQRRLGKSKEQFSFGLTTAFEQGVFSGIEKGLQERYGVEISLLRQSSPQLVKDVLKGKIDLAFVALPLETHGLTSIPLGYTEPYIAVVPEHWPQSKKSKLAFKDLSETPLFWFKRELNKAMYDFTHTIFSHEKFTPFIQEEPLEHDVLLARIAKGEGVGFLPSSFAIIHRKGVVYKPLRNADHFCVTLGIVFNAENEEMAQSVLKLSYAKLLIPGEA